MKQADPLEDFVPREIAFDGAARRVYVAGSGPAVIVMNEMPGCPYGTKAMLCGGHLNAPRICCNCSRQKMAHRGSRTLAGGCPFLRQKAKCWVGGSSLRSATL
jgi:hypothetical protein